jgi:DNA-binding MarR family transcriptional regulator
MTREAGQKESPLDTLPTTRRAILNLLKREGPLTANAVARALSLTSAAIRMQLVHLEEDGLLARDESVADTGRRGRPSHVYTLTSAAEALYPKRYGDLTTELLGYLGGPDGEQVNALFEQRRRRRVDGALPRLAHLSFWTRTATWPTPQGKRMGVGSSPSTTAPFSPWPTGSPKRARASSPSSATRCRAHRWSGWPT